MKTEQDELPLQTGTKLQQFLYRINQAQPLSPVTMYFLGVATAGALEVAIQPDGLLFDAVLHATDMQRLITKKVMNSVLDEMDRWVAARSGR